MKDKEKNAAGEAWRDRLHKTKSAATGSKSKNSKNAATVARNKFTQTASGSTDRKSRKGLRPG